MNRTKVFAATFLVGLVGVVATFLLPSKPFSVARLESSPVIEYDSATRTPVYQHLATGQTPIESFSATMEFKPYSTKGYTDLFQTAPLNKGIRVELRNNTVGLVIGAKNAFGYDPYLISSNFDSKIPHTLEINIDNANYLLVWMDHQKIVDASTPDLRYTISNLIVGGGYSRNRTFKGRLTFRYSYAFYVTNPGSKYLPWARFALIIVCVVSLFLLVRAGDFKLSSLFTRGGSSNEASV